MKVTAIVDMQFGSTGKGLIAGWHAGTANPDAAAAAWGPNAGHTYIDVFGHKVMHRLLPIGTYLPSVVKAYIGPGAMIVPDILQEEITAMQKFRAMRGWKQCRILIHEHAAVVRPHHVESEKSLNAIGSTQKGTAEAVIQKMRRDPSAMNVAKIALAGHWLQQFVRDRYIYLTEMLFTRHLQVEGAQGYSLSMHHGFYPWTTGRDTSTAQVLADCGVPMKDLDLDVIGVARTYPIRVANRYDDKKMVGWSGPCYPDQEEITWESIGMEPELTTVTKLPRRIFTFSRQQIMEAVDVMGVDKIFLNFVNYLPSVNTLEAYLSDFPVRVEWVGIGPAHDDVIRANATFRCEGRHKWGVA